MSDQEIKCIDCSQLFVFNEKEQAFFVSKGFVTPKRCVPCRVAKREQRAQERDAEVPLCAP